MSGNEMPEIFKGNSAFTSPVYLHRSNPTHLSEAKEGLTYLLPKISIFPDGILDTG